MTAMRNVKIASYINCIGLSYCEVPLSEAYYMDLPIVYGDQYRKYSTNAVNILGDVYTSVWLKPNAPQYIIKHDDSNKNGYSACEACYSYIALNCNSIAIAVPRTCGCIVSECGKASDTMYVIFVINKTHVEVLRVDRLPLHVLVSLEDKVIKCPAVWMLHLLKDTCTDMLKRDKIGNFRTLFERCYADGVLFRVCNARFLKELSLEDFQREVKRCASVFSEDKEES